MISLKPASHPPPLPQESHGGRSPDEDENAETTVPDTPLEHQEDKSSGGVVWRQSRRDTDESELPSPLPTDPRPVTASETRGGQTRDQIRGHLDGAGKSLTDPQGVPGVRNASGDVGGKGFRESSICQLAFGEPRVP